MEVHVGDISVQCRVCGQTFAKPSTLMKHLNLHKEEDLCDCHICTKFLHPTHLKNHMVKQSTVPSRVSLRRKKTVDKKETEFQKFCLKIYNQIKQCEDITLSDYMSKNESSHSLMFTKDISTQTLNEPVDVEDHTYSRSEQMLEENPPDLKEEDIESAGDFEDTSPRYFDELVNIHSEEVVSATAIEKDDKAVIVLKKTTDQSKDTSVSENDLNVGTSLKTEDYAPATEASVPDNHRIKLDDNKEFANNNSNRNGPSITVVYENGVMHFEGQQRPVDTLIPNTEYVCPLCNEKFPDSIDLEIHVEATHSEVHSDADDKDALMTNQIIETSQRCTVCSKTVKNLKRHMQNHLTEKPHPCDMCSKSYTRKYDLTLHKATHNPDNKFPCTICDIQFTRLWCLKRHMTVHGARGYFGEIDVENEKHVSALTSRLKAQAGGKQFICDVCGNELSSRKALRVHMARHTDEKSVMCHFCGKKFFTKGSLKTHMHGHTGERPYKCHICQKGFPHGSKLKRHINIHTQDWKFKCHICSKEYLNSSQLKSHMMSHTGEKPFSCRFCEKKFRSTGHVKRHEMIHVKNSRSVCESYEVIETTDAENTDAETTDANVCETYEVIETADAENTDAETTDGIVCETYQVIETADAENTDAETTDGIVCETYQVIETADAENTDAETTDAGSSENLPNLEQMIILITDGSTQF